MEFQKFCKEKERMCKFLRKQDKESPCLECGINRLRFEKNLGIMDNCNAACVKFSAEAEQIVKQWVKEHPIVRNCDKLHEIFGNNFKMMYKDVLNIDIHCNGEIIPMNEWMNQEYKEPEGRENEESNTIIRRT